MYVESSDIYERTLSDDPFTEGHEDCTSYGQSRLGRA